MGSRDFKDDQTIPEANYQGAPRKELDVEGARRMGAPEDEDAPTWTAPRPRAEDVGRDGLWEIYDQAQQARGRISIAGAPRDLEQTIAEGCARLRAYLASEEPRSGDDDRRAAVAALQLRTALEAYEAWRTSR